MFWQNPLHSFYRNSFHSFSCFKSLICSGLAGAVRLPYGSEREFYAEWFSVLAEKKRPSSRVKREREAGDQAGLMQWIETVSKRGRTIAQRTEPPPL